MKRFCASYIVKRGSTNFSDLSLYSVKDGDH